MAAASRLSVGALTALLAGSAALHVLQPTPYKRIVPAPLRSYDAQIVALSGVCELVCAVLVAATPTRRFGGGATALLFVAVFPANVQMALDGGYADAPFPLNKRLVAWLRLPVQIPLILWALRLRRAHTDAQSGGTH